MRQATCQNTKLGTDPRRFLKEFHRVFHAPLVAAGAIQNLFPHPVGKCVVDRNREGIIGKLHHQGRGHIRAKPHRQNQGQNMVKTKKRTGSSQDSRDKTPRHRAALK